VSNKIWNRFAECRIEAIKRDDRRHHRLGAVAERADGTLVKACNGPTRLPKREMHAEYRVTKKIDYDAIIYVARVLNNGKYGMAMPCVNCIKAMTSKRVKKVYFTIDNRNYGVITLQ